MNTMLKTIGELFAFVALAASLAALLLGATPQRSGADEQIDVELESALVKVGEPTSIVIRVTAINKDPRQIKRVGLPDVEGIAFGDVVFLGRGMQMAPDQRNRMTQRMTLNYQVSLQADAAGTYEIPSLNITIGEGANELVQAAPLEPLRLKVVEDIVGSRVLALEMAPLPERLYEGEPFTVELDLGWLTSIDRQDQILQIPWFGRQDGVIQLEQANSGNMVDFPIGPGRRRTAAMERLGAVKRGDDEYLMFRLSRRFVATRPGTLDFARSVLQVTERRSRGRFGRQNLENYFQVIPQFSVEVVPVPDEGRPVDWTGAVGDISVDREALKRDIDAGDTIEFELRYSGEGNLEFFSAPDLDRLPGFESFRVLGVEDDKQPYLRVITYDLVPTSVDVTEVPPVPLSVFDTETETFKVLKSEPMEIRVRAGATSGDDPFAGLGEGADESVIALRDIDARPASGDEARGVMTRGPGAGPAALSLLAAFVGWVSLRRFVRRRGDPSDQVVRRRRAAFRRLEKELGGSADSAASARAIERFLAARTGTQPEAWIGRSAFEASDGLVASSELQADFGRLRASLDRPVFGAAGRSGERPDPGVDHSTVLAFARRAIEEGL